MSKIFIFIFLIFSTLESFSVTVGDYLKKIAEKTDVKKKKSSLPQIRTKKDRQVRKNIEKIRPPRFSGVFDYGQSDYAKIEKEVDKGISQLIRLVEKYKNSRNRGEYWLRLGEFYSEKAQLIEFRKQEQYEKLMKLFSLKQRAQRPILNLRQARQYNLKAIELYKWFIRDFPKDPKKDQALFFLAYNYFEMNKAHKAVQYYKKLIKSYKRSAYIYETYFALAEYYFEKQNWKSSRYYYSLVAKNDRHRLYALSLYKLAWVYHKTEKYKTAFRYIDRVLRMKKSMSQGKVSLKDQALASLVLFYSYGNDYRNAFSYFTEMISDQKSRLKKLADLADYYSYTGSFKASNYIYKKLIQTYPYHFKSFDYQKEIVRNDAYKKNSKTFLKELLVWIQTYNKKSKWYSYNRNNPEVDKKASELESFVRSYALKNHKTAQKTKSRRAQARALKAYEIYLRHFKDSENREEMMFYQAELYYDLRRYLKAAKAYKGVILLENKKKKYFSQSIYNLVLSYEKRLPSPKDLHQKHKGKTGQIPLSGVLKSFEKAAFQFMRHERASSKIDPIKYRLAMIYYYLNHFKKSLGLFYQVLEKRPKSMEAKQSAHLILDIYNLKKDYDGLIKASSRILKIKNLPKKLAREISLIKIAAIFSDLKKNEKTRTPIENARKYESFAKKYIKSPSGLDASYNSGVNYEKAKKWTDAIRMYLKVIHSKSSNEKIKMNALRFVGFLYRHLAQYKKAIYYFKRFSKTYPKHRDSMDMIYNVAILSEGFGDYQTSISYYNKYLKMSKSKDRYDVLYILAGLWEKKRNYSRAISFYNKYVNSPGAKSFEVLESLMKIGRIQVLLRRHSSFFKTRDRIKKTYIQYKKMKKPAGLQFVSEADLTYLRLKTFKRFNRIKITGSQKLQQQRVQRKLKLLNQLKEELKNIVSYKVPEQVVSSLALQGEAFYQMYKSIIKAPLPKLARSLRKQYKEQIQKIAIPFKKNAIQSLNTSLEKAWEFKAYNQDILKAMSLLRSLDPYHPGSGLEKSINIFVEAEIGREELEDSSITSEKEFLNRHSKESDIFKKTQEFLSSGLREKKGMNLLALYYLRKNRLKMAKVVLNESLRKFKNEALFLNNLGIVFLKEKDIKEAEKHFKKALKIDSDFMPAIANLSAISAYYRDHKRVVELTGKKGLFNYYSQWDKEFVKVINNYAISLSHMKKINEAQKYYLKALEMSPKNPWIYFNYAYFFARFKNNFKHADEIIKKITSIRKGKNTKYYLSRYFKNYRKFKTLVLDQKNKK